MKQHLPSVCLGVVAAAVTSFFLSDRPATGQQPERRKERWDYIVTPATEDYLKKAIGPGYELVAVAKLDGQEGQKFIFKHRLD
ncbi:MAG TPA: hypothetical protein VM452_10580 [Caulifigura sp.]|jgi:hypothetical protein|nr:hypothetical protein [Caulifigura sp.]